MKVILGLLVCFLAFAFSQGNISGTLYADDVRDFVIIGCLLDLSTQDCDYDQSPFVRIESGGTSATYTLPDATLGNYIIIAWKDTNGNGVLDDDGSDEIGFYVDANSEPALVTSPASGIDIRILTVRSPQPAINPLSSTPAQAAPTLGDLVGIWQMTRASGGDYTNLSTGLSFSMTSGFSTLLKIRSDGSYLMQFFSSGVSNNCQLVTNFESSAGTVTYQGNQLILQPQWRTLELSDCDPATPNTTDLGTSPIVYTFSLQEEFDHNGLRSIRLGLEGGVIPFNLRLLHREPLMPGYQPQQPADFMAGTDLPYQELIGLWTPFPHSDIHFYNPQTGDLYLPEYNGAEHSYLRLNPEGSYEMSRFWGNYSFEGVCKKDYIYYERGRPTFAITQPPQYDGGDVLGHVQFNATDARLIVNIRECGEDTGVLRYTLIPQVSYYRWNYRPESNWLSHIPEGFSIQCAWEKSEWQFMFCDGYGFSGRSYGRKP